MKGYRTIILAAFPLVWAILNQFGVNVPLEDQGAIVAGVTAVLMIAMRSVTDSKMGES